MKDGEPFAIAGLWEHWEGQDGQVIESCTLLTTEPNDRLAPIHNRMPVILDPKDYNQCLIVIYRQQTASSRCCVPIRPNL